MLCASDITAARLTSATFRYKGAFAAPLFFSALALTSAGSVVASPSLWAAAVLALAFVAIAQPARTAPPITLLGGTAAAYVVWAWANCCANSTYSAAAVFDPLFLAAGFCIGRGLEGETHRRAVETVLAGAGLLSLWALGQALLGEGRAHAAFETPNTLASVLNLALAPTLVYIAYTESRRTLLVFGILISAALTSTLSRGGFIALAGALFGVVLLARGLPSRRGALQVLIVLAIGCGGGIAALLLPHWLGFGTAALELRNLASTDSGVSRLELYRLAFSAAARHPWLGTGYLGFNAVFEAGQAQVPSYGTQNFTNFVHNDYLQLLLELGVPGFIGITAFVLLPFALACKRIPAMKPGPVPLLAALAGSATMAVHALVDFPFYIPVCLVLFGGLVGQVDRLLDSPSRLCAWWSTPRGRIAAIGMGTLLAVLIFPPAIAEAAVAYGEHNWRRGNSQAAAFGFELARRFQPRDWRYHWYAGQFWFSQATQAAGNDAAARRADQAFTAASAANPSEPRPVLARIATQVRFAARLRDPQGAATLRAWADHALALAPLNPGVRRDYQAALTLLGHRR